MSETFIPVGAVSGKVVVDLASRRPSARGQLIRDLKGSITLLDAQKAEHAI